MALRCRLCETHVPDDEFIEWIEAHGEEQHDGKTPEVEAIVVCKCGGDAVFRARVKSDGIYDCPKDKRTYYINMRG